MRTAGRTATVRRNAAGEDAADEGPNVVAGRARMIPARFLPTTQARRRDIVATSDLFRGLPAEIVEHAVAGTIERRLREGEALFFKEDPSEFIAIVAEGRLYRILYGPRGQELIIDAVVAGETVGETALLERNPRDFTAMAYGPTLVLILPRRHFGPLLGTPALIARANDLLRERLRRTVDAMEILCLHQLESRLARRILSMIDDGGRASGFDLCGEAEVELPPTQSILAAMVNVSRPKLNAQLQKWRRIGLTSTDRNILRIHDVDALRVRAGLTPRRPHALPLMMRLPG